MLKPIADFVLHDERRKKAVCNYVGMRFGNSGRCLELLKVRVIVYEDKPTFEEVERMLRLP